MKAHLSAHAPAPLRVLGVASHPIQYQAPWFRALAQREGLQFSALFIAIPDARQQGAGFGVAFEWDIPLLDGYAHALARDVAGRRGAPGFAASWLSHPVRLLREAAPDVLLLTGWHTLPLVQLLLAARWLGIPVVMRGESNALRPRGWRARLAHRALLSCCAAFLPIGRANRDFYLGYGVGADRLFYAPYFVDNARFEAAADELMPQRDALRARWGITPDAVCFCFAGKFEPKKRPLDLIGALALALRRPDAPRLHVLMVGSGELLAQARAAAEGLPVTFAGFMNQSRIPEAYAAADCLVLPSDFGETWGLVVNEAMVSGRPAIVSDRVGCGQDLIVERETGAMVPFGDVPALADALLRLAADRDALGRMGTHARARVKALCNAESAARATEAAVMRAAGRA